MREPLVPEESRFGALEAARGAPFDHVRRERPRRAAEADERHLAGELLLDQPHGVEHVAQLLLRIGHVQAFRILGPAQRLRELRTVVVQDEVHPHRLGDHQDVAEEDGSVDAEDVDRLQRHLGCEVGRLAKGEEGDLCADGTVFGQIPSRLPHEPHGRAVRLLLPACLKEPVRPAHGRSLARPLAAQAGALLTNGVRLVAARAPPRRP